MIVALDQASEKRVRAELDLGHYKEPAQVIAAALERFIHVEKAGCLIDSGNAASDSSFEAVFGLWAGRGEDGVAYQHRMRDEW